MISVIYSAINPGATGLASVQSVLRSLPGDSEIVFYLDPSSDESEQLLASIKDKRFRLIESASKLGFAKGLNVAAEESRGSYIARLDADDLTFPWRWRYQLNSLGKSDIHFGSLIHQFVSGGRSYFIPHYPVHLRSMDFKLLAIESNPGFHPAAMMHRSVFFELHGYSELLSEDYDFWLRAANAGYRFERGIVPVTLYRHHSNQATKQVNWQDRAMNEPEIILQRKKLKEKLGELGVDHRRQLIKLALRSPMALLEFRHAYSKLLREVSRN